MVSSKICCNHCLFNMLQSSVFQWLEKCLERKKNCEHPLQNPFLKNYWSDLSLYHGNLIKPVKRYWNLMESFTTIEEESASPVINIVQNVEWNSTLCLEYSYADYEQKIINEEISFNQNENPKKDFRIQVFKRKLAEILSIKDEKIFNLCVTEDVAQRIDEISNNQPFSNKPAQDLISIESVSHMMKRKKKKCQKSLTFMVIGTIEVVTRLKNQFLLNNINDSISHEEEFNVLSSETVDVNLLKLSKKRSLDLLEQDFLFENKTKGDLTKKVDGFDVVKKRKIAHS